MWGKQDPAHEARLAEQGLTFGPPPAWILEREIPLTSREVQGALHFPLSDTQIDLTGPRTWTHRLVQRALNSDGVGRAANFTVSFDPSFEKITIHRVRVVRDGQVIDLATPDAFQLLRRETNLERRLYDGRYTADMQIPDLRPGDVVDTWFTTIGSNPALKDAFDARFSFEWSEPVDHTVVRVRAPESRKLSIRSLPQDWRGPDYTETRVADGLVDREWSDRRGSVFRYDDSTPDWWVGHARMDVTDTAVWSDIADLFHVAYAPPADLPASLVEEVDRIAAKWPGATDRVVQALRFVQREVRYLAISIGEGGHIPRSIEEVWSRRFGDCKDVSRLLCGMLRRLGIDATPALVNTRSGEALNEEQPGVHAFNHCIARVHEGKKTYWLDATMDEQGGDLDRLYQPQLGWALPLEADAQLERMEPGNFTLDVFEMTETFLFGPRADSPAELKVVTNYRGWRADGMRSNLRREGIARMSDYWHKHYAKNYGGASVTTAAVVTDDLDSNTFTLTEHYTLDKPWNVSDPALARFSSVDDVFGRDLSVIPYVGRVQPLSLGIRRRLKRLTLFKMPKTWNFTPWHDISEAPGLRASSSLRVGENGVIRHECSYEITSEVIENKDFETFREQLGAFYNGASVNHQHPIKNGIFTKPKQKEDGEWGKIAFGVFIIVLILARVITLLNGS